MLDLKQLLLLICDNKTDIETNLILDEGCVIHTVDPKPLVKVLNYVLNFLAGLTDQPLQISLDLHEKSCTMGLMALSAARDIPQLSENVAATLADYRATVETIHEKGRYFLVKVVFSK